MAAHSQKPKLVAADTNVLIDVAANDKAVRQALKVATKKIPASFIVTPTVLGELVALADNAAEERVKNLALIALRDLKGWGFAVVKDETPYYVRLAADEILARELLPPHEKRDALIIGESAWIEASLLVSSDPHMWNTDVGEVNQVLFRRDLKPILIIAPWRIIRDFGR